MSVVIVVDRRAGSTSMTLSTPSSDARSSPDHEQTIYFVDSGDSDVDENSTAVTFDVIVGRMM